MPSTSTRPSTPTSPCRPVRSAPSSMAWRASRRTSARASPIRTALVTARAAPAHYRVVNTLRSWGVNVDETYFLGGVDKAEVLAAFGAHIFFDDQRVHVESAATQVPAAQVLWSEDDLPAGASQAGRRGRRPGTAAAKPKAKAKSQERSEPATPVEAARPAAPRARARSER